MSAGGDRKPMAYKAPTVGKGGNKKIIFDYNQFEDYSLLYLFYIFNVGQS